MMHNCNATTQFCIGPGSISPGLFCCLTGSVAGDPFRPDHPGTMPAKGQRFPRLHTNFTYKIRPVVGSIKYIQCKAANERARRGRNDPPGSVDVKRSLTCPADVQRNPGSFDMSGGRGPARQRVARRPYDRPDDVPVVWMINGPKRRQTRQKGRFNGFSMFDLADLEKVCTFAIVAAGPYSPPVIYHPKKMFVHCWPGREIHRQPYKCRQDVNRKMSIKIVCKFVCKN